MDLATIPAPEVDEAITLSRQQLGDEERSAFPQFTSSTYAGQWELFGPRLDEFLLNYAPVFQAVGMISGDVAMLPRDIYRRLGPKARELDTSHPAYRVVRLSPEVGYNAQRWFRRFMVQALIYSNAYAIIHRNGFGQVTDLELLESSRMDYERRAGRLQYRYQWSMGGWQWFEPRSILHLEDVSLHQDRSWVNIMQPLWQALLMLKTVKVGLAAEDYVMDFFDNGGRTGGILTLKAGTTKKTRDAVEEGFKNVYENREAFKTITLREDVAKFTPSQMTGSDAQLSDVRNMQVSDVARWYRLPPHKLGLPGSPSYNSIEEENEDYFRSTLQNWTTSIESECNFKLIQGGRRDGPIDHFVLHDTSPILRLSPKEQMAVAVMGAGGPVITVNEGRAPLGYNPVEGGDEILQPLNMAAGPEDTTPGTDKGTAPRRQLDPSEDLKAFREAVWPAIQAELETVKRQASKGLELLEFHHEIAKWEKNAENRIVKKTDAICRLAGFDARAIALEFIDSLSSSLAERTASMEDTEQAAVDVCGWHNQQYKELIGCEK